MIIPEKQNIVFKENTILEVKSGILIMESKIKNNPALQRSHDLGRVPTPFHWELMELK
jgi:hypothetical protein